ncbi:hypothetical protein DY218_18585 [Streptomyces triticagri]|uniref:Uncharacterized protein n=1 Tax=Streptomyces triticagri TaxID=2293568 RepID=A0A372M431_9ACTN|nr:hypothetical protein [Streptomyces triticagri]RFU85223.1 hypothetical protein DY218_18585 [Streptomyces triticagri]
MSTQTTNPRTPARVTAVPLAGPVPCDGRLLDVPAGRYDWIRLRVSAPEEADGPRAAELDEEVWLHYGEAADPEWLRGTGSTAEGHRTARIPVPRRSELRAVRLPRRAGVTVLAADCVHSAPVTGGWQV